MLVWLKKICINFKLLVYCVNKFKYLNNIEFSLILLNLLHFLNKIKVEHENISSSIKTLNAAV